MKYAKKLFSEKIIVLILLFLIHLFFFSKLYQKDYHVFGSDAEIKHYPTRFYLYENLKQGKFPYHTDRVYGGFDIAADFELAYLNPVNVLTILLFGPFISFKVLFFLTYVGCSYYLYLFLKRIGKFNLMFYAAVTVFFYSFFTINHLIHFNIVLVFPILIPVLYYTEMYFSEKKLRYLVLAALFATYTVYWGHPQTTVMIGLTSFIYSLFKEKNYLEIFKYWALFGVFALILSLPQLIPSYKLYQESYRSEGTTFRDGSFNLVLFSNAILPFQYGKHANYFGNFAFEGGYSYTEIYIYFGITAFILSAYSFFTSKTRMSLFAVICMGLFFFFTSARYVPFADSIPILEHFRHWNRAVIFGLLGMAILLYELGDLSIKRKINVKRVLYVLGMFLFFSINFYIRYKYGKYFYVQAVDNLNISKATHTVWVILVILTIIFLINYHFKFLRKISLIFFLLLIMIDLRFYYGDGLTFRIKRILEPVPTVYIEELQDKNVLDFYHPLQGYQFLNTNYNSPYGYAQLAPGEHVFFLREYGFDKLTTRADKKSGLEIDQELIEFLDLDYVILPTGEIQKVDENYYYKLPSQEK